jgi:hypothetical protein
MADDDRRRSELLVHAIRMDQTMTRNKLLQSKTVGITADNFVCGCICKQISSCSGG